uniref:Homologous-pairing protein 2 homolog n=1 Tax=Watanabea reniformis TaxID=191674 RepID=A0A0K0MXM1_9CHLO|nr:homologous pairing protein 2 [Watanabea reniformis]
MLAERWNKQELKNSMVEQQVLHFIEQQNRPYNAQIVADNLAQYGLKKGPIQKALDALSEAGKITCKEFGKTKIYLAPQDGAEALNKEEQDAKLKEVQELTDKCKEGGEAVRRLRKALADTRNTLTLEQIECNINDLQGQIQEQSGKLETLRSGATLISSAERVAIEKAFSAAMSHWAKRKRIFYNIWNSLRENIEGKIADLFEDIGVETDEAVDADLKSFEQLLPKKFKVR